MVDRMKQLQRNTVTNADIIDGALVLKRYDGSRLTVDSGTNGVAIDTASNGSKAIQIEQGDVNLVLMASGDYDAAALFGVGTLDDVENESVPTIAVYPNGDIILTSGVSGENSNALALKADRSVTMRGPNGGLFRIETDGTVSMIAANNAGGFTIDGTTGALSFIVPDADPHVFGAIYTDAGTLKASAG